MNTQSVEITSQGIRKVLNKYTPQRAIAEYVWNGYDAHATEIWINIETESTYDSITKISVLDNGDGIVFSQLPVVFKKFYESHKSKNGNLDSRFSRGKNGYGRFTFYKFASEAIWETVYNNESGPRQFSITMRADALTNYKTSDDLPSEQVSSGTKVTFKDIINDDLSTPWIESILKPSLRSEFAWYFKVHPTCKLYINDELLDCSSIIADSDFFDVPIEIDGHDPELFHCSYFQWAEKPQEESSKLYFMAADGELKAQRTTLLNNKGDSFWHSILVNSTFFNSITDTSEDDGQTLFSSLPEKRILKSLIEKLNTYLRDKRRPFLKRQAEGLIQNYEHDSLFSFIGDTPWEQNRRDYLKSFMMDLYEVEPSIFTKLNGPQKSIFVRLLDQVMDTDHNECLFKILEEVVDLSEEDREHFASILETTRLKNIISTIQLLTDRLSTIKALRAINFDHSLKAGEIKHLQKIIQSHYWIFGEEYRLVCAEETKFEEALSRYKYFLHGVSEKEYIDHPDKYKEMDLFITGKEYRDNRPSNLVVEIKNPTTVPIMKMEQYGQINTYMGVIMSQDGFNDESEYWTFMLIGLDIDDVVCTQMKNKLSGLCVDESHFRLFVKKWSQVLNEAESRINFLIEKLQIERDSLTIPNTADAIVAQVIKNNAATCVMPS